MAASGLLLVLTACTGTEDPAPREGAPSATTSGPTDADFGRSGEPSVESSTDASTDAGVGATPAPDPISVAALAAADLPGGGLAVGAVREQAATYTSYDVTFDATVSGRGSRSVTISGVLNVPTGRGPHPAVVLAHGYIDPAYYERGQGMTRERGYLADAGYVALHVDYRNHAESDKDPRVETAVRLGYSADVIAAARALVRSDEVQVDADRIALFGRSMGGGVMLKALAAEPGLFAAGVGWASVSSLEAENFEHFQASDAPTAQLRAEIRGRHGLPADDPAFWRGVSARPHFDQIAEPVLMVHGRSDETCPPRWASATHRALRLAGVDATLEWYDDQHAFGPAFTAAMQRTVRFLGSNMPG